MSTFLGLEEDACDYDGCRVVVLPVPFERTTSYGKGTAHGPRALLLASTQVELFDEELQAEPWELGIFTADACSPGQPQLEAALEALHAEARRHVAAGKFLLAIGGEHGITPPLVRALAADGEEIGVVQFDAHADLREEYEGTRWSHACAMRRVRDLGIPTLGVGLRSLSAPEAELIDSQSLPVVWGRELEGAAPRFAELLDELPESVYLTFDVDYFDPSLLPATGTPEPGGGSWYPTLKLLRLLFARKRVLGMDLVELSPIDGQPASDFVAARLAYKCIGYLWASAVGSL